MATGADTRASYEQLVALYAPVAAVVFVLVVVALVIVGMRFRARPGRAASSRTRAPRLEVAYAGVLVVIATLLLWRSFAEMSPASTPDATHGGAVASGGPGALTVAIVASSRTRAPRLEVAYAGVLVVIATLLLWRSFAEMSPASTPEATRGDAVASGRLGALTVAIVASRWNWRVLYPGGVVQTGDGHGRVATLVVPADQAVRFRLTSSDVVHALWIPALRVKYDAMARYVNTFTLRFARGLDYSTVRCSEFCGELHDQMRMHVDVRSPVDFDAWLRTRTEALRAR